MLARVFSGMRGIAVMSLVGFMVLAFPAVAASHRLAARRPACPARHAKMLLADPQDVGVGPALDVVAKPDGAVAWLVSNQVSRKPGEYEVHVVDRLGSRVVAVAPDVQPSSLAIAGNTLYWTQEGKPASTRIQ
jgi:hypothetical protein